MPSANESIARISRFVSIAVITCVLMTGGMWAYNNRSEFFGGSHEERGQSGSWFTRWAGVDITRLKVDESNGFFDSQAAPLPSFEFDPGTLEQLNKPIQFDWDSRNR